MPMIDPPVRKAFFWPCVVGVLIAIGCVPSTASIIFCRSVMIEMRRAGGAVLTALGWCARRTIPMLAFGVVCLAFDVDDDPEHASCGGGTVRSHSRPA